MQNPISVKRYYDNYVKITFHFDNTEITQLLNTHEQQELAEHFREAGEKSEGKL
jgi:hypothetical protein